MVNMRSGRYADFLGLTFRTGYEESDEMVELWSDGGEPSIGGFEPIGNDVWERVVHRDEVDAVYDSKWLCEYKGEPCGVIGESGGHLGLDYLGHDEFAARAIGFTVPERFVAVGEAMLDEVDNLREVRTVLWPEPGRS